MDVGDFVRNNDFSGKTVVPFCTSASSSLDQSGELLAETAGVGDWQEGMRFRSSVPEQDVIDWVRNLYARSLQDTSPPRVCLNHKTTEEGDHHEHCSYRRRRTAQGLEYRPIT